MYGGPGCRKSTMAAAVFAELKFAGVDAELVTEYAKELTWQENYELLACQDHVYGEQAKRIWQVLGKVDVIVTDSPLLLSCIYSDESLDSPFCSHIAGISAALNSLNIMLARDCPYNENGRIHSEVDARLIDCRILEMLSTYHIPYVMVPGNKKSVKTITDRILSVRDGDLDC